MTIRYLTKTRQSISLTLALLLLIALVTASPIAQAQDSASTHEKLELAMLTKIKDEGLNRSQVMDHLSWLSDVYGPRLTGSPTIKQASEWVQKRFKEWGLANIHEESWPFGKGWSLEHFSLHLIQPQTQALIAYPKAWSSG